ncbi:MAG: hypothetical protein NTV32_08105 [Gammaproteobacteria bacterium]|nr:hypothetical protein [Gammaproteobacteria bacterium]
MKTNIMNQMKQSVKHFLNLGSVAPNKNKPPRIYSRLDQIEYRKFFFKTNLSHDDISYLCREAYFAYRHYRGSELFQSRPHVLDLIAAALKLDAIVKMDESSFPLHRREVIRKDLEEVLACGLSNTSLEGYDYSYYAGLLDNMTHDCEGFKALDIQEVNALLEPHFHNLYLLARATERIEGPELPDVESESYAAFLDYLEAAWGQKRWACDEPEKPKQEAA